MNKLFASALAALIAISGIAGAQNIGSVSSGVPNVTNATGTLPVVNGGTGAPSLGSCLNNAGGALNAQQAAPPPITTSTYTVQPTDYCKVLSFAGTANQNITLNPTTTTGFTAPFATTLQNNGPFTVVVSSLSNIANGNEAILTPGQGCTFTSSTGGIWQPSSCNGIVAISGENYLAGVLPSNVTHTGATNGTTINSSGVITANSANTARFPYNPVTLAEEGLEIEQASTNLYLHSGAINTTNGWSALNSTLTGNSLTAPDGTTTGSLVNEGTGASEVHSLAGPNSVVPAAATYIASYFVQPGTQRYTAIRDFGGNSSLFAWSTADTTGVAVQNNGLVTGSGIQTINNSWYRPWESWSQASSGSAQGVLIAGSNVATAPATSVSLGPTYTGTSQTWGVWGIDVAEDCIPTTYVPTVASTVTRSIDSVTITSIPSFNPAQGTLLIIGKVPVINPCRSSTLVSYNDGTANNQIKIILTSSGVLEAQIIISGTAYTSGGSLSAVTPGTPFYAVLSYNSGSNIFVANGVQDTGGTFAAAALPTGITQKTLGDDGAQAQTLNGFVQLDQYWNTNFSVANMIAIAP